MGFPDGGVGGVDRDAAALIWQLQSIVNSDLVADDAKLDLVKDYGSDTTVSHHGKWSRWSSPDDIQRSRNIRIEFARALGIQSGGGVSKGTGNAELDKIISRLASSQKPLTKREVKEVLAEAKPFVNLAMQKHALSKGGESCKGQLVEGNNLSREVGDFEKKVQDSKVRFSKAEIDDFQKKYAEAQKLSGPEAEKIEQSIPREIRDQLAVRKEDYQLTMDAVGQKKEEFLKQYHAAYPDAKKDISFEDAVDALKKREIKVPEDLKGADKLKGVETMTLQQLKAKRLSLEYEAFSEYRDSGQDGQELKALKAQKDIVDALLTKKNMMLAAESAVKVIGVLEDSVPKNVRAAIADNTEIKPDLDQFLEQEPGTEGSVADKVKVAKIRSGLLDEIKSLKAELKGWTRKQETIAKTADGLLGQEPGLDDARSYHALCDECLNDIHAQNNGFEAIKAKLDKLQERYNATFAEPKKAREAEKKDEGQKTGNVEVKDAKPTRPIDVISGEIEALKVEIDNQIKRINASPSFDGSYDKRRQIMEKSLDALQKQLEELKAELKEAEKFQTQIAVGQDKPKVEDKKPIVVKLFDLDYAKNKQTAATIRDKVRKLLKESIPDFDQWVATLKDGFIKDLKLSDVSAKYFEGIWKDDLVVRNNLDGQGGGSQDNIGAKVVDILKDHAKHAENNECQINPDEFKQELRQKLLAGYQDSYEKEHWGQINAAQENLTKQASTQDFIKDLNGKFQEWQNTTLKPLKGCLPSAKFQLVEKKADEAFTNFMQGIQKGQLLDVKDKTLFNHLIESLAPSAKNSQPNVDSVLLYSLNQLVKGYGLAKGFDGTSKPNLDLQNRIEQKDDESPHAVIQGLLNLKPGEQRKGLVQKGGYSCWMISIVNGLLNSVKGREVLSACFAKKDEYVFPALDKDAKTKSITVKLDDVRNLLKANPKAGISQLEAAIWLGVETMRKNPNIYSNTAGCKLGQMGEASEVATLFGLQGQSDENGKSSGDDSQIRWADGANALHGGRIVVLHRGPPNEIKTGHFMAVVGSQLDQKNDNAQSFDICDSLSAGITTNVGAGKLVTPFEVGSDKLLCNTVMVYDFPPAS